MTSLDGITDGLALALMSGNGERFVVGETARSLKHQITVLAVDRCFFSFKMVEALVLSAGCAEIFVFAALVFSNIIIPFKTFGAEIGRVEESCHAGDQMIMII